MNKQNNLHATGEKAAKDLSGTQTVSLKNNNSSFIHYNHWLLKTLSNTYGKVEWIECRKTKTNVITLTNQNRRKQHNEPIRI